MMDNLRTKANSPFIKVLLAIIILSFVLTGVAGYMIGGSSNDAAKVNGQSISRSNSKRLSRKSVSLYKIPWVISSLKLLAMKRA